MSLQTAGFCVKAGRRPTAPALLVGLFRPFPGLSAVVRTTAEGEVFPFAGSRFPGRPGSRVRPDRAPKATRVCEETTESGRERRGGGSPRRLSPISRWTRYRALRRAGGPGCPYRVEGLDRRDAPRLALGALGLGPDRAGLIRREDEAPAGGDLDAGCRRAGWRRGEAPGAMACLEGAASISMPWSAQTSAARRHSSQLSTQDAR